MKPIDPLPIDPRTLATETLLVDIVMQPAETALLRGAAGRGLPVHPGRTMLAGQVPANLRFFGHPDVAETAALLLRPES